MKMDSQFDFFKTTMPKTRKADYYLGCLDGEVFMDFNRSEEGLIRLRRISFDSYGCCDLDSASEPLPPAESRAFIKELNRADLNQKVISGLVLEIIKINKNRIWADALEEYGLL